MDNQEQKPKIEYIRRWQNAIDRLLNAERELNYSQTELLNSVNELGRILCPKDAKVGEIFSVWTENRLVVVEKTDNSGNGSYKVSWRK